MNSLDYYSYRIIGKLTAFFAASGVHPAQSTSGGLFTFRRAAFLAQLRTKVNSTLAKAEALPVNLKFSK